MKISKKDQDPSANHEAGKELDRLKEVKSEHFAVGTWVKYNRRRAEIIAVLTCKCRYSEKGLRIRYEDGTLDFVKPFALNRKPLSH